MPRTSRVELEGGIHHVTMRGNRGLPIFHDQRDYSFFVMELEGAAREYRWTCLSYCLMPNHCHLVVETPEKTLGLGMRYLAGRHAQVFNQRHETYGHLFQGRFGSRLVRSNLYFAQLLRYVALNPVGAGLCERPSDWRWSSHRALIEARSGTANARARIESLLEAWGGDYGARYEALFDPAGPVAKQFGAASPWTHRPPLADLFASKDTNDAILAARECGYRLADIAEVTGLHPATISKRAKRVREGKLGVRPRFCR